MNRITIELCTEDRARLDGILAVLGLIGNTERHACKCANLEPVEKVEEPQSDPIEAVPEPALAEEPEYKLADIQQKVVSLSAAGKKAEVKAVITQYADKVSGIPAEKYGEVMAQLTALEG